MKLGIVLTSLLFFSISLSAQDTSTLPADEKPVPRTLIKIAPLQFVVQTFELSVEALNRKYTKAFQISAGYRSGHTDYDNSNGITLTLAFRKYARPFSSVIPNTQITQGIYYSLYVRGEYFKGEPDNWNTPVRPPDTKINSFSPGFVLGVHRQILEVLYLDAYVGGGIKFADVNSTDNGNFDIFHPGYEGIYPAMGVKIGIGL